MTDPVAAGLPDIDIDLAAAGRVMDCENAGLRAYALAGGLDPASDFQGLDLRGWELAGQDLRGFNFSGCDLRGTGIQYAQIDTTTVLLNAVLDSDVQPGSDPVSDRLRESDLLQLRSRALQLNNDAENHLLVALGRDVLPLVESQFDPDHPVVLEIATYVARGEIESGLNPEKALARLERALVGKAEARNDVIFRFARHMKACALDRLGAYAMALEEAEALLSIRVEVDGPRHPETLNTRRLRASVLQSLGQYGQALAEVDALLPIVEEVRGPRDPQTLPTRYLRASVLADIGHHAQALDELDTLLAIAVQEGESTDRHVLAYQSLRAGILIATQSDLGSEATIRAIVTGLRQNPGPHHLQILRARYYRLARLLLANGRRAEARSEIEATIAAYDKATDPGHRWLTAARRLLAVIDGTGTGDGLPP